jgi:hypothetical protein
VLKTSRTGKLPARLATLAFFSYPLSGVVQSLSRRCEVCIVAYQHLLNLRMAHK